MVKLHYMGINVSLSGTRRVWCFFCPKRGFLLLEVVVAVAVLAIVLAPLLSLFVSSAVNNSEARMVTTAANLAREKMETVKGAGFCRAEDGFEGEVEGFPGFSRAVEVKLVEEGLKQVTVVVCWTVLNGGREYCLASYLGR